MVDFSTYSDDEIIALVSADADAELRRRGYTFGWHKKTRFAGAIYILVNPAFPTLVKIGYADDVQRRMKTLNSSSGLPDPFHCYAIYKVKSRLTDLKLHALIDSLNPTLRHSNNREFYDMDCGKAYEILYAIAQINGDEAQLIRNPFDDSYFAQPTVAPSVLPNSPSAAQPKKGNLTFRLLGIPIGSTLCLAKDPRITCTTADDINQVSYKGQLYSLSKLAAKLLGYGPLQGGKYFKYQGEVLTDMRERLGV